MRRPTRTWQARLSGLGARAVLMALAIGMLGACSTGSTDPAASGSQGSEPASTTRTDDEVLARLEESRAELESYLDQVVEDWDLGALAVGVVTDEGLAWSSTRGERVDGEPVDADTRFEIGSTTKAFLGVTLAMLVERGLLDWDDPVREHYPDFQLADAQVTEEFRVRDLLAQRSGLPASANTALLMLGWQPQDAIDRLRFVPPAGEFRETFAYQNAFHLVASEIVADKLGVQTWPEAVEQLLLDPLGMERSGVSADILLVDDNTTRGSQFLDGELRQVEPAAFPANAAGSGGLVSTLDDLAAWVSLHLGDGVVDGEPIIAAEQLATTYEPLVVVDEDTAAVTRKGVDADYPVHYATGWFIHDTPEGPVIEHDGLTSSYAASISIDPERGFGVVVLTNLSHGESAAVPISNRILDVLQGRPTLDYSAAARERMDAAFAALSVPEDDRTAETDAAAELVGEYGHPIFGDVTVEEAADGQLELVFNEIAARGPLFALGEDRWVLHQESWPQTSKSPVTVAQVLVVRDANDAVSGFSIDFDTSGVVFQR